MMPDRIVMDSQGRVVKGQKQAADPDRIVMDGLGKVVWQEKELPVVEESDKQAERVQPEGEPLPEWTERLVEITPEDVALAIAEWNKRVPEARGLLGA